MRLFVRLDIYVASIRSFEDAGMTGVELILLIRSMP